MRDPTSVEATADLLVKVRELTAERDAARDGAKTYKLMLDEAEARERAVEKVFGSVLGGLENIVRTIHGLEP
jgi:hypothetical protein